MKQLKAHVWAKEKNGHYVEPSWVSRRLFEVEDFKGPIWDPACGWGTIVAEARAAGLEAYGSDIVDRIKRPLRKDFSKWDFIARDTSFQRSIVCTRRSITSRRSAARLSGLARKRSP